MLIELHDDVRPTRVRLHGRFDAHEVERVEAAAAALTGDWVLDLAGVHFVDSSGLAALVAFTKRARATETSFTITGVRDEVRLIFEITKVEAILPIVRS